MQQTKFREANFERFDSIEEFVKEKGWYVPSLHEKYLNLVEKDRKEIKLGMKKWDKREM